MLNFYSQKIISLFRSSLVTLSELQDNESNGIHLQIIYHSFMKQVGATLCD